MLLPSRPAGPPVRPGRPGRRLGPVIQRRVGGDDPLVQILQRPPRLEAKLVGHALSRATVGRERLSLPSGPEQGEHQLFVESFPERVPGCDLAQFSDDLLVPAQAELSVDPPFQRLQPHLGQPGNLGQVQPRRLHAGEGLAEHHLQRLGQLAGRLGPGSAQPGSAPAVAQPGEPLQVELAIPDAPPVARRHGLDPHTDAPAELAAEPR